MKLLCCILLLLVSTIGFSDTIIQMRLPVMKNTTSSVAASHSEQCYVGLITITNLDVLALSGQLVAKGGSDVKETIMHLWAP